MTTSRKPTAGFWITVALVAVLVGYPLSWGAWLRCMPIGVLNEGSAAVVAWGFYAPLYLAMRELPEQMVRPYSRYLNWASRLGR